MNEQWRPLPNYDGLYEISDQGNVRSLHFSVARDIKPLLDKDGYFIVMLSKNGKRTPKRLHRLVALAFHSNHQNALHSEVAHMDGVRTNCRASNLKWVSKVENHSHKRLHGTHQEGDNAGHRILTSKEVEVIRRRNAKATDLASRFGVSRHTIYDIWQNRIWTVEQGPARRVRAGAEGIARKGSS